MTRQPRRAGSWPRLSEHDVTRTVLDIGDVTGWSLRYHTHNSLRSPEGFPDWIFLRHGRLVALELKGDHGRITPQQAIWIDLLCTVPGVDAAIIRPENLDIAARLLAPQPREGS